MDKVNHPDHYQGNIECIDYIESLGLLKGMCLGNAVKYIHRAGKKSGESETEDLGKAVWYLQHYLNSIGGKKTVKVKVESGAFAPVREHATDAGIDIKSPVDAVVRARDSALIHTGIHVEVKDSAAGVILPKSGLNIKHDILSFGVVDEGYSGEVMVKLYNFGDDDYHIRRGDKITQLLIMSVRYDPVEIVDAIEAGERGNNGFGSTGR